MTEDQRIRIEAAAFRTLLSHLAYRSDVQNIDMMGHTGFCRNCLADWYQKAAADEGVVLDKADARAAIYGMSGDVWKEKFQQPATDAQMALMKQSLQKNEGRGF